MPEEQTFYVQHENGLLWAGPGRNWVSVDQAQRAYHFGSAQAALADVLPHAQNVHVMVGVWWGTQLQLTLYQPPSSEKMGVTPPNAPLERFVGNDDLTVDQQRHLAEENAMPLKTLDDIDPDRVARARKELQPWITAAAKARTEEEFHQTVRQEIERRVRTKQHEENMQNEFRLQLAEEDAMPYDAETHKFKTLDNTSVEEAKARVSDLKVVGDGNLWQLLCKASSEREGWMKSTKALEIAGYGCLVQVTTQQHDHVAEAVTFVPGVCIVGDVNGGRKLYKLG